MIQYMFSVPRTKVGVETLLFAGVCDEVSIVGIDQPLVAIICGSASTLNVLDMLTIH